MSHPVALIERRHGIALVTVVALLAAGCGSSGAEEQSSSASIGSAESSTTISGSSESDGDSSATDGSATDGSATDGSATDALQDDDLPNLALGGRTLQVGAYSLELSGLDLEVDVDESAAGLQLEILNPNTLAVASDSTYFAIGSVMGLVPAEVAVAEMQGPPPPDELVDFGTPDDVAGQLDTVPGIAVVGEGEQSFAGEPLFWWDIELDPDRPDGSTVECPSFVPRGAECVLVVAAEDWGGFVTDVDRLRLYWSPNLGIGGSVEAQREGFDEQVEAVDALLDGISAAKE